MPKIILSCTVCQQFIERVKADFKKNKSGKFYCSKECSKKGRQTGQLIYCLECKKEFYKKQSELTKSPNSFCSRHCSITYNNKLRIHTEETKNKISKGIRKFYDTEIPDDVLCEYGCNEKANYVLTHGRYCCSDRTNKCSSIRLKNSLGLKLAYSENRKGYTYNKNSNWSKNHVYKTLDELKETVFCINSSVKNDRIKKYLLHYEICEYKCLICNLSEWNNLPLVLELDHINGVNNDNQLDNLRLLCLNCHSQTDTFRGKNVKVKNKSVNEDLLIEAIKTSKKTSEVLIKVGLVPKGANYQRVKRIMEKYDLKF